MNIFPEGYIFKDNRETFIETFLFEMPEWTIPKDYSKDIVYIIKEKQKLLNTIKLTNNLYKMEGPNNIYYWYEENGNILLGAEFEKERYGLRINFIGKLNKRHPPYASDLYLAVLNDRKDIEGNINSIITSDNKLSDEGFNIWSKLLKDGHEILVFNPNDPSITFIKIHNLDELTQYFSNNKDSKNYRYVLSESPQDGIEIWSLFRLRRMREMAGIL
jgi:hypothetical protein